MANARSSPVFACSIDIAHFGDGERLFGEISDKKPLRLLDSGTVGDGLAYLTYELEHMSTL